MEGACFRNGVLALAIAKDVPESSSLVSMGAYLTVQLQNSVFVVES